jgi:Domain of unknown function (DUF4169)
MVVNAFPGRRLAPGENSPCRQGDAGGRSLYNAVAERSGAMIVNLNKARKQRQRAAAERQAAANRVRFGRTRAERESERRAQEHAEKSLDDKRLE